MSGAERVENPLEGAAARRTRFKLGASVTFRDLRLDPVGTAQRFCEEEPVSWFVAGNAWIVARRPLVEDVVRSEERFTADWAESGVRRALGMTMLTASSADHGAHRKPFDPPMRVGHVHEAYPVVIDRCVQQLLDGLSDRRHADLIRDLTKPLALDVLNRVLGFDFPDRIRVNALVEALSDAQMLNSTDEDFARAEQARADFAPEVVSTLERARQEAPDSILGMVARRYEGDLSDEIITANTTTLIFGGAHSTATLVGTSLWSLLRNPQALAEVRADPSLLPNAIDETARLRPVFATLPRWATQDATLGGVNIAAGDEIWPLLMSANRDPVLFENPHDFDLHRSNVRQNTSFGRGLHFCIGQNLARLVATRATEAVLAALPGLRLDPERSCEPEGFELHGLDALNVVWDA